MKILFLGVIVGRAGRHAAIRFLSDLGSGAERPDLVIANADFASEGSGLTGEMAVELMEAGVDVITMGQNVWSQSDLETSIETRHGILRPLNLPESSPGSGITFVEPRSGGPAVGLINLLGYTFISKSLPDNPFPVIHRIVRDVSSRANVVIVDFYAVPSAEKVAMRYHLDGMVSFLAGTGTLVQTADEQVSKTGTASITDVGMVGAYDSVVGFEKDGEISRFTTSMKRFPRAAEGRARLDAVACEVNPETGWTVSIRRISEIIET
jgi:metallophosphoesterase (TIGR00282 family)